MRVKFAGNQKFISDWIAIVRGYVEKHMDFSIPEERSSEADIWLANLMVRIPKITPRAVEVSDVFKCPAHLQAGWELLRRRVEKGEDLKPHLSRQIKNVLARDEMLAYWHINHFHIGTIEDPKHVGMMKGGSHIVYAFVDDHDFHALALLEHGHWTNVDLVEILKRNWPSNIHVKNLLTDTSAYTHQETLALRKYHINAPTPLSDGSSYVGFGEALGGASGLATSKALYLRRVVGAQEWKIRGDFNRYFPDIKIEENSIVNATLVLNSDFSFSAKLPDFNIDVLLDMPTMPRLIESLRG